MSKRRYTNMLELLPAIKQMLESGMRRRQIEDGLGLEERRQRPYRNTSTKTSD